MDIIDDDKEIPVPNESTPFVSDGVSSPAVIVRSQNENGDTGGEISSAGAKSKHLSVHYQSDNDPVEFQEEDGGTLKSNSQHGTHYDTKNLKSFKNYTREALPRMEYYRNLMSILRGNISGTTNRPTLDELHGNQTSVSFDNSMDNGLINETAEGVDPSKAVKFGWIKGVLIRNLLNIWGVILFMRLSWVAAQAGIIHGTLIILLASACTVLTAMSMAAICTNGEVKGGGTYYMISRSLGPEFGGAIGIIFSLANAVAVAMYTVGFAETLRDVIWADTEDKPGVNSIRLISCITVVILLAIVFVGTSWEAKAQILLLVILLFAMASFLIGAIMGPRTDLQIARGYFGWNVTIIVNNLVPDYREGHNFFSTFAVYFPAATGILAGANISGDLKDPSRAIPLGTFLAIGITTVTYIAFHFIMAANVVRDANGLVSLVQWDNETGSLSPGVFEAIQQCPCPYGLMNNFQIVELMSWYGPIIYAGIFAAALSSALASLVSAPKVFQALCNDRLFPYISYLGRGYGPNNEPRPGYLLAFGIAICCCLLGELNVIAPIISNFFLAAYTLINFSCFHASFSKSPGFRPSFRFYNQWVSLFSAILMTVVMFITNWTTALLTFLIILVLYMWIMYRKPNVNWGSSTQAQVYRSALTSVHRLNLVPDHVKNYRPQILFLGGHPKHRPDHVDLAYLIIKNTGLLICGNVVTTPISVRTQNRLMNDSYQWLAEHNIKAFVDIVQEDDFHKGSRALIQLSGIGKLRPNIVMLGFKTDWNRCETKSLQEYFNTIHSIFDYHLSIVVFRHPQSVPMETMLNPVAADDDTNSCSINVDSENSGGQKCPDTVVESDSADSKPDSPSRIFLTRQSKGAYIDVWWLYDDGGLTLLLPYLIRSHSHWSHCKLRVFALANKQSELDTEQRNMAALLSKFRIDYSSVILITDILKPPKEESKKEFRSLIEKYLCQDEETSDRTDDGHSISTEVLEQFKDKNNRNIRLRELLIEYSKDSRLIVMTLPMPRKESTPAVIYMAWLETLTRDMPPMMLMRGNQTNVLTFYS